MNAILIHGAYGDPQANWPPWLKSELEKSGYNVFAPKFPTPENQSLASWLKVFDAYSKHLDEETILVGHSLGCAFILNVLEKYDKRIKAAFLVAGFVSELGKPRFDGINETFTNRKFDLARIRKNCGSFTVLYSDNDPNVPEEKAKELARLLGTKPILIAGAGHFNKDSGYSTFQELLDKIKETSINNEN